MDQYLSTVIVALITGIFSIITLVINKRQEKVISKIDEQTTFLTRERDVKKQIQEKEKEREYLMHEVMILVLETNLHILRNTENGENGKPDDSVYDRSDELKAKFEQLTEAIRELNKEYELVMEMTEQFRAEIAKRK